MAEADRRSEIDRTFRQESGRAVASLIRVLGDFDLAEEAVQEAFVVALERWPRDGVPSSPGAWITQVARNRAIDRLRRAHSLREKTEQLEALEALRPPQISPAEQVASDAIEDDRLRLIFTCCHPALAPEARVGLTLRTLGGLTTPRSRAPFWSPSRRWRSASSAPRRRSRAPGSRTRSRAGSRCRNVFPGC